MNVKKQTPSDKLWKDETGLEVPFNRITKSEKLREVKSYQLVTEAAKINAKLKEFKELIREACTDVANAVREENKMVKKDSKGNFIWFNFDRSIMVECNINEQIAFDDTLIALCQEKLNEFLSRTLEGSDNAIMIRELVKDGFENTRGRLDAKKVMSLLKHKSKIDSKLYQDAMGFLEQSIRRPESKTYYRVSVKNGEGKYDVINLNFSSI